MQRQRSDADPQQHDLLRVCRIGRAQGLKGDVTVQTFTTEPERRFAPGSVLVDSQGRTFTVAQSRTFHQRWIVRLSGVEDRTSAEALNGTELYGEPDDPEEMAEEGVFYPKDLIGMTVVPAAGNALGLPADMTIGTVADVIDGPQTLLKIRLRKPADGTRDALVPFVEQIVPDVDPDADTLTLDPPGGLIPGLGDPDVAAEDDPIDDLPDADTATPVTDADADADLDADAGTRAMEDTTASAAGDQADPGDDSANGDAARDESVADRTGDTARP